jgi:phage-related minor tail protein
VQLGEAFITLSMSLPPNAAKEVESQATKSGQAAADAFTKAAEKATKLEAKDAFKQFPDEAKKAGTTAGTALGKAVSDASSKMVIKSPDLKAAYAKAGEDAGTALAKSVDSAAAKMTIKSPDIKDAYERAGRDAGKALTDAVSNASGDIKLDTPDITSAYARAGRDAGGALSREVNSAASSIHIDTPDVTSAYRDAGKAAGSALNDAVDAAASNIDIDVPNVTSEYRNAGSEAGKALADSANTAIDNIAVDAPDATAEFGNEGERAGKSFGDKFKSLNLGAVGKALSVQFIGAFDSEMDLGQTTRNFEQQLGATGHEAKALGLAAGGLYADGLADGMDEAEQAITSTINAISGIRDQGAPAIAEVASAALGLSKAFGQDLDATLRATGQLMRTGLAKDGKEAMDLIAAGLQRIPGSAEDLLDTFTEYSVQFKKLGLDGKDALGVIAQMVEGGARNTDLAADAMKEFSIRAVDGSQNVADAFRDLGFDAEKMTAKFAAGGPEARKAFGDVVDALNKMEDPLKRNLAGVELFGSQWEDLGDAFRKVDLNKAAKELGEIDNAADNIGGNTFAEKFQSNLSKLSGIATVVGGALGISFGTSFDDAMDFSETRDKVARDLGLTKEQASEIGKAAGDLYAAGLGEGLSDVTESITTVGKAMPEIAKQGVPALKEVTEAALRLQKNFKVDVGESSNAVGKMIKTGLVKDATQGFDLIATGMAKIPRAGEDLIDTVNEYSVQFQKLGLTGEDTFGLIKQMMEGGARDTDLAADALKEFSIRAVEAGGATEKTFKEMGFNAKEMIATFAKGGPEARAAFGQVVDALNKMEDPVKRNAAGVALFGTQWEDLGGAFKSVDLDTAAAGLGKIDGANKQLKASTPTQTVEQFKRAIEIAFINILADKVIPAFSKFIEFVKNNQGLLKTLAVAVGVLGTAYVALNTAMAINAAGGLLNMMKTAITSTKAWTAAQFALNAVMKANPIALVVTAVTGLIAVLVLLYKNNETVRKAVDAAWDAIKKAMGAVADWWTKTAWPAMKRAFEEIKPVIDAVGKAIKTAWDAVKAVLTNAQFISALKTQFENFKTSMEGIWKVISGAVQAAWAIIKGVFDTIKAVLSGDFKGAWTALQTMIQGVWEAIKKIISGAWDVIRSSVFGQIIAYLGGQLKQAWESFKSFIEGMWNGLKTFFSNTWTAIKTTVFDAWQTYIKGPFTAMWNAFKAFFEALWNGLKTFITTTWNAIKTGVFIVWENYIKGPFTAMWNAFKAFFTTLWNGLKTFLTTTWNAIKTTIFIAWETYIKGPFMTMWNTFKTFFTTLWNTLKTFLMTTWTAIKTTIFDVWSNYIKGPFTAMWNAFKTFFTTLWNAIKTLLTTTWTTIKTTVFDVWSTYIKGPFTAMWNAFKTFITTLWNGIKTMLQNAWTWIKTNVFTRIKEGLDDLKVKWQLWKTAIGVVWDQWKEKIKAGWDWVKGNVFEPLREFIVTKVPGYFKSGVDAIGKAWDKVKDVAKKPVEFVVNTVIRDGIVKGFNAVASKVGVGTIDFKGMATGGVWTTPHSNPRAYVHAAKGRVLPGYTPGRDVHRFVSPTGGVLDLSGGEAVMRPEFTRAIGKGSIDRLNAAARAGGVTGVRAALGLKSGGVVGTRTAVGPIGGPDGKVKAVASTLWESITGIGNPITGIVNKLLGKIPAAGWMLDLMKNTVTTLMSGVGKTITSWVGGGGGSSVGGGATPGSDGSPGGWASMWNWVKERFPSAQLYSGYRNSRTLSGNLSLHASGRAIDITPNRAISDAIIRTFGKNITELISPWPSDHYHRGRKHTYSRAVQAQHGVWGNNAHIHWAMRKGGLWAPKGLATYDDGGWLEPGQTGVNMGRKPEAVLTPEESAGLKGMGLGELIDKLDELIDAVERVAPGVTAGIRGAGAGLRAAGRTV